MELNEIRSRIDLIKEIKSRAIDIIDIFGGAYFDSLPISIGDFIKELAELEDNRGN